tara:strand:- start:365 stop:1162 length:798 start_codon:yes stop_codon:yes gene_type:complete
MPKIIYYYQTLVGLKKIINNPKKIYPTHIILSAFHFGVDINNISYIHLNNYKPSNKMYNDLWIELKKLTEIGVNIMIMLGGAGGAYNTMFNNFDIYYSKLYSFLKNNKFIKGIDLDIEENVDINNVRKLIKKLDIDFGKDYIITMAPISGALTKDYPGLGGFSYKDLIKTDEGKRINWFNGQFYYEYNLDIYNQVINNGYNSEQIVIGMAYYQFTNNFEEALKELNKIKTKYNEFSGVFVWEYFKAPSLTGNPEDWCVDIYNNTK